MFYDISGECFREVLKEDDGSWLVSFENPSAPRFVLCDSLREDMKVPAPAGLWQDAGAEKSEALIKREELIAPLLDDEACIKDAAERLKRADAIAREAGTTRRRVLRLYYKRLAGRPLLEEKTKPVRVPAEKEKDYSWAVNTFYYSAKKMSLRTAYDLMILSRYTDADGNIVEGYPTWPSFRHYYYRRGLNRGSRRSVSRNGLSYYQRKERPVSGSSKEWKQNAGSFQIDETPADIYLVSRLDRSAVIGRPNIYLAVDTATELIAGVYVGLESGEQAMINCLTNAAMDKVEYCGRYGIDIKPEDWPNRGLPGEIVSDKGKEFIGSRMKEMIMRYGIDLEALPPFRPDEKGVVEKSFDLIQEKYKPLLRGKGVIEEDAQERWAVDYRAQAVLTLEEFTKVVINCILYINRSRITDNSIFPDAVPTAAGLWNRYAKDGRVNMIPVEADELYHLSLPRKSLPLTRKGLSDKGLNYMPEDYAGILKRHRVGEKVTVAYDVNDVSCIYLIEGQNYIPVPLSDACRRYAGATTEEYRLEQSRIKSSQKEWEEEELKGRIEVLKNIKDIADSAEHAVIGDVKTEEIRKNRKREVS